MNLTFRKVLEKIRKNTRVKNKISVETRKRLLKKGSIEALLLFMLVETVKTTVNGNNYYNKQCERQNGTKF